MTFDLEDRVRGLLSPPCEECEAVLEVTTAAGATVVVIHHDPACKYGDHIPVQRPAVF